MKRTLASIALTLVVVACAPKPSVINRELPPGTPPLNQRIDLGVPRASITFTGRVMSISPDRSADSTDVCATAPCMARVEIRTVNMVGVGGPTYIKDGDEMMVEFPMTLLPTEYQGNNLPGLNIGSIFQGMGFEIVTMQGSAIRLAEYKIP